MNLAARFGTEVQGGVKAIPYMSVILKVSKLVTSMEVKDTDHHFIKI